MSTMNITLLFPFRRLNFVEFEKVELSNGTGLRVELEPDQRFHTGKLEGINNKIKVIKRQTYGFHDLEYFKLKVKQACPGKH